MPQWRNWQTRNVQVVVWVTMYRFESCLGHWLFSLNLTFQMPQWRNWQTRNVQVVVWVTMYRFESCLGHYSNSRYDTAVFYLLNYYDVPTINFRL